VEQLYDLYQANTTQEKPTKEAEAEADGGNTNTLENVDKIDTLEE
jgi:hypothetical protein